MASSSKTGRNDPCPCGSGKKYKKCCLRLDRMAQAPRDAEGQTRRLASEATVWEADIRPVPVTFGDEPEACPANLLVLANGFIVDTEVLLRPSPEPEAMAEALERAVLRAAERLGKLPERIEVRHEPVARHLAERLASRDTHGPGSAVPTVEVVVGELVELDRAMSALAEELTGRPPLAFYSCPETWAGWGLPAEKVDQIFRAAADFYRAAPWERLDNQDLLDARSPADRQWTLGILGAAGQEFGLNLYASRRDVERICEGASPDLFRHLEGRVLAFSFKTGSDLPKPMRREISRRGWEVADAAAYPMLMAYDTPAGGLLQSDAEDLLALLGAVPRFLAAGGVEAGSEVSPWEDPESGFELTFRPHYPEWDLQDSSGGLDVVVPYDLLEPGEPEGPGADPEAALRQFEVPMDAEEELEEFFDELSIQMEPIVKRFTRHLEEVEEFAPSTVEKHTRNAKRFVDYLVRRKGIPVAAVHEMDLSEYLWDWHPRQISNSRTALGTVVTSLRRFFAFLAEKEGVVCSWTEDVLADREWLENRWSDCPGGFLWDPLLQEWRQEGFDELRRWLLLPEMFFAEGVPGGGLVGSTEARLEYELERRWLLWRDEILRSGVEDSEEVLSRLLVRQEKWENTPHPNLAGTTPGRAIAEERQEGWEAHASTSSPSS